MQIRFKKSNTYRGRALEEGANVPRGPRGAPNQKDLNGGASSQHAPGPGVSLFEEKNELEII